MLNIKKGIAISFGEFINIKKLSKKIGSKKTNSCVFNISLLYSKCKGIIIKNPVIIEYKCKIPDNKMYIIERLCIRIKILMKLLVCK